MPATLNQLQQFIKRNRQGADDPLETFVGFLFEKASPDLLETFDTESLLAVGKGALAFMQDKPPGEVRVRVYNPSYGAEGWEAPYTALELTLRDRPFIVDSVRAALRREGYEVYHLLHPILKIGREDGKVADVAIGQDEDEVLEAYELYLIEREDDPQKRDALEASIRAVLEDVVLATDDYLAMREKTGALRGKLAHLHQHAKNQKQADELEEYAAFMDWLADDNFVFLGYREYDITDQGGTQHLVVDQNSGLGVLSKMQESAYTEPVPLGDIPQGLRERILGGKVLTVTKTNAESTVHRPARMDYVGLKKMGENWQVRGERRFVGLFTSKALSTSVEDIPILRHKLRLVLDKDKATPGSHDYKRIVTVFNSVPREELFWSDASQLYKDIRTVMNTAKERGVRLTVRPDPLARGLAVMVIMPRERFNADVRREIQGFLADKLAAEHVDYQLAMGEDEAQVRFHFFFTTDKNQDDLNMAELEGEVADLTRTWNDHLLERLMTQRGEAAGRRLAERYADAFDERYKADTSSAVALRDIENLETLGDSTYLVDILNPVHGYEGEEATQLKIYHQERTLVLSEVLPILENLGFKVLEQISYYARASRGASSQSREVRGIDIFRVQNRNGETVDVREHGERIKEALLALLTQSAESDTLNRLVLYGNLSVRQVALLRTLQMYYAQLSAGTSRSFVASALLNHPNVASLIYRAFDVKFKPEVDGRETKLEEVQTSFSDALQEVASLSEDQTLRGLFNLVTAAVRTNFFLGKPYISLKLDSSRVTRMPEPRPLFEIAMSSPTVEGTHLRGGKVARGGLRWSDRPDDFRTEVLGLMKTQMTKNAVIVPVGSKGGFVVKHAPTDRDALREYVRTQYRTYIRSLLDLTDNQVDGETVQPGGVVVYDEPDPYLVVAADKGTATFSDLANETAAEYDFWLGDAFASGGSHGYDHKEEAITANGAWECVKRHLYEMGTNVYEESVSVAGIGDMSGDVFGNGLLYTDTLKLQAAFNHLHIFLDPDPDPKKSFEERKRLFEKPRSSWEDYNEDLISEGGGVYSRFSKSIPLTPQVKAMLDVDADALSGQDLIQAILKMPVDLLWNGGIGTYVKASSETHADVGDSSNNAVRVDAPELRAKVVGEGGNLGFTQLARVEYARRGGRINTDAIDNSGGVDMSDHEVNIKIALRPLVGSGDLSFVQRNRLLDEMTDEVSAFVLRDNYEQSLALSLAERRSKEELLLFASLQEYLAERGPLKPEVEFLPNPRVISERQRSGEGLTRPELAILLAYTKMGIYRRLLETDFPDEPHFQHYLFDYFPSALNERFPEVIQGHSLRREIIATQFTNTVVDLLGVTFVHRSIRDTGASPVEVIRAALVALEILGASDFLERVFSLDYEVSADAQYTMLEEFVSATEDIVAWILLSDVAIRSIPDFVETYKEPMSALRESLESFLPRGEKDHYRSHMQTFTSLECPNPLAAEAAAMEYLPSAMGIVDVSRVANVSVDEAAKRFYSLGERLSLGVLRDEIAALPSESKWEKIALGGLVMDLRRAQLGLTIRYFEELREGGELDPEGFLETHPRLLKRYDAALEEIHRDDSLTLASGGVLARLLLQTLEEAYRPKPAETA